MIVFRLWYHFHCNLTEGICETGHPSLPLWAEVITQGLVTLREARSQSHGLKPQLQAQAVEGKSIQILFQDV